MNKKIIFLGWLYLVALLFFAWGIAAGNFKIFPWEYISAVHSYLTYEDDEPGKSLTDEIKLDRLERRSNYIVEGFKTYDPTFTDSGYLLISRYSKNNSESIIELFSLQEQKVVHSWTPPFEEIAARSPRYSKGELKKSRDWDIDNYGKNIYRPMHPLLLDDGSIVFHIGEGPLVRIDASSSLQWVIDRQFHHSLEQDQDGNLVLPVVINGKGFYMLSHYRDDGYAVISLEGEILQENSVTEILLDNGYRGLLFGVDRVQNDRIHLNDVQPIFTTSSGTKRGDIAFSSRTLSTVFLYRPETGKVVWLKTGPWLKQHDINQLADGRFSVFGNDVIDIKKGRTYPVVPRKSEIYIYNPLNNEISQPFTQAMTKFGLQSNTEGRLKILDNGDAFMELTNSARLLRISDDAIRWEYVNSVSPNTVGYLHWSRYIPADRINLQWKE